MSTDVRFSTSSREAGVPGGGNGLRKEATIVEVDEDPDGWDLVGDDARGDLEEDGEDLGL